MKSLWRAACLSTCFAIVVSFSSFGQCNPLQSITYDTLVKGTGSDDYTFTFPQFNPMLGTLASVKINSIVSLNYGFTLQNTDLTTKSFKVMAGREDFFQSPALSADYDNFVFTNLGTYPLIPGGSVTKPSSTVMYRVNHIDSITNVINFLGNGSVLFNYSSLTFSSITGSNKYNYSAIADDTIHFSMTYFYCNTIVLSDILKDFSANKEGNQTVQLSWIGQNETAGRIYEIEKSTDGNTFAKVGSVSAEGNNAGNYTYSYRLTSMEGSKLWFRLKITDESGTVKYSEIRWVDMGNNPFDGAFLYPNPSDQFVNIVFNAYKDWHVDIINSNGSIIQSNSYINTNAAHIVFIRVQTTGIYFARIREQQTGRNYVLSFVVR